MCLFKCARESQETRDKRGPRDQRSKRAIGRALDWRWTNKSPIELEPTKAESGPTDFREDMTSV